MRGAAKRMVREYNQQVAQAWITAAVSRAKKMPKLEKLLVKDKPKSSRQSWEQQLAVARMWHDRMGKRKS